jgi:hypothetical protein
MMRRDGADDHEKFLEFLHIAPAGIGAIRQWSPPEAGLSI